MCVTGESTKVGPISLFLLCQQLSGLFSPFLSIGLGPRPRVYKDKPPRLFFNFYIKVDPYYGSSPSPSRGRRESMGVRDALEGKSKVRLVKRVRGTGVTEGG